MRGYFCYVGVWLSWLEHRVWDAGVVGSSPTTPTRKYQDAVSRPPKADHPDHTLVCNLAFEIYTRGYSIVAIMSAFQAEDVGSIPTTRSIQIR